MSKEKKLIEAVEDMLNCGHVIETIATHLLKDQSSNINSFSTYIESQCPSSCDVNAFLFYIHNMIDIELIRSAFVTIRKRGEGYLTKESQDNFSVYIKNLIKSAFENATGKEL